MIPFQQKLLDVFLVLDIVGLPKRRGFVLINAIGLFVVVVEELVCPVALLFEPESLDGECADLEGTQGDVFCKLFVENLILLGEVDI